MVAFYKEVCIIYGAEHPLHILLHIRACSSAGRAFGSHPRGRGFESHQVHHNVETKKMSLAKSPNISGFLLPKRRFFSVPKRRCKFPAGTVPSPGGLRPGAKRGLTNRRSGGRVRVIQKPMSKRSTRRGAFQRAAGGGMAAGEAAANGLYEGGEKAITACNTRRHPRPLFRRSA